MVKMVPLYVACRKVLAANERVSNRTAQSTRLTLNSTANGAQAWANWSAWTNAKAMLVRVQETTSAASLQVASWRPRNQSQAEANEGRRNPRKASSSNIGAIKVPNRATIHTSPGVLKKSSIGSDLGMGRKFDENCTTRLNAMPDISKTGQRRRTTEKFHCT